MKIARDGYPYILVLAALSAGFFVFHFLWLGGVFLGLALFVTFFFRDPERVSKGGPGSVISPADGKVVSIRKEGDQEAISIFLSVFNVHVNRSPVAGKLSRVEYHKGKFLIAFDERASTENERNSMSVTRENGMVVRFVQIAGLIARRIVCWKNEGENLAVGERVGLIKFGSRVDVFMPPGSNIQVKLGQKVKAGETIIAELP